MIYFTGFYSNIYDCLNSDTTIYNKAITLSQDCQNDNIQINKYFEYVINNKWNESGSKVTRNLLLENLKEKIKVELDLININLVNACEISINSLLPDLKKMKDFDIDLVEKRNNLVSLKSSLSSLKAPSKYDIGEDGNNVLTDAYKTYVGKYNILVSSISSLTTTIQSLLSNLNTLKASIDSYIMQISELGGENIAIPSLTLPSDINDGIINQNFEQIDISYEELYGDGYLDPVTGIYYEPYGYGDLKVILPNGKSFIEYNQSQGRSIIKLSGVEKSDWHVPQCGPCAYASVLSYFGYSNISPENVGYAIRQFSSFSALNPLISGKYIITGTDNVEYSISSAGIDGEPIKAVFFNVADNSDLKDYIENYAENTGQKYSDVAKEATHLYAKNMILETFNQGGVVTVRTSATSSKSNLSFTQAGHFIALMGIDSSNNLIISNSTANYIKAANNGNWKTLKTYTKKIDLGERNYSLVTVTLDEFIDNNILGCQSAGNSITCITDITCTPLEQNIQKT
ncbi:MAG: hypothetical protein PHD02_00515 [Bacilli bacterium]|nr:hypothetical protein [Bacilli bacterium]